MKLFKTCIFQLGHRAAGSELSLDELMWGKVSEALKIPKHVVWGSQSGATFKTHYGEFMKPVVHIGL